ncbi:hypothetical protein ROA7450_03526 [Roseovarius albus]|uniref:Endonuclease/exonuclease/phosphatase domain-containing protein n=1 Tax=Roseovarius albus TaxID=1247867 RepID=A0A1X7A231_9RHOB|nr:endonuclease/exonuclease/phosphatase family protein [Roseovarius albus]SLN66370.1 hypothetical protein ROA7450_03526 [Roseovarius albus]
MCCTSASADSVRIATYNTDLSRNGPGLLLRDILRGNDPQVAAVATVITRNQPDILLLQAVDYDLELCALKAFNATLTAAGVHYPHIFASQPNTGMHTTFNMNLDGHTGGPKDAQSYGEFSGQSGMAILSRFPIQREPIQDFSAMLWKDTPDALLPDMPTKVRNHQRLSYVSHWIVPITVGKQTLNLMAFHASPPVFDGPEDRNGRRNHDEIRFWQHYLDGAFGAVSKGSFIIIGDANLDPVDSEGRKRAIQSLLKDPRLQDPAPQRSFPISTQPGQYGDPMLDTVHWPQLDTMRVDYILPSVDLRVTASGVYWPDETTPEGQTALTASRHRLVWVDIALD